ncbi:hypothetical protein IWQ61_008945 [Dispira simplex]|nr:hypothetical protein IWQ61_008945 [Dispira simplex]
MEDQRKPRSIYQELHAPSPSDLHATPPATSRRQEDTERSLPIAPRPGSYEMLSKPLSYPNLPVKSATRRGESHYTPSEWATRSSALPSASDRQPDSFGHRFYPVDRALSLSPKGHTNPTVPAHQPFPYSYHRSPLPSLSRSVPSASNPVARYGSADYQYLGGGSTSKFHPIDRSNRPRSPLTGGYPLGVTRDSLSLPRHSPHSVPMTFGEPVRRKSPGEHPSSVQFVNNEVKTVTVWTQEETRLLLTLRKRLCETFIVKKRNKILWKQIAQTLADHGFEKSWVQCQHKWKNMARVCKETMDHNSKAPTEDQRASPFQDEIKWILDYNTAARKDLTNVSTALEVSEPVESGQPARSITEVGSSTQFSDGDHPSLRSSPNHVAVKRNREVDDEDEDDSLSGYTASHYPPRTHTPFQMRSERRLALPTATPPSAKRLYSPSHSPRPAVTPMSMGEDNRVTYTGPRSSHYHPYQEYSLTGYSDQPATHLTRGPPPNSRYPTLLEHKDRPKLQTVQRVRGWSAASQRGSGAFEIDYDESTELGVRGAIAGDRCLPEVRQDQLPEGRPLRRCHSEPNLLFPLLGPKTRIGTHQPLPVSHPTRDLDRGTSILIKSLLEQMVLLHSKINRMAESLEGHSADMSSTMAALAQISETIQGTEKHSTTISVSDEN